jgi:large subunit ribosomal protein L29
MAKKGREKTDLKSMTVQELEAKLRENQESYFRLRFRHASSPLKNPMQIRAQRREIAQVKTWLKQKGAASV